MNSQVKKIIYISLLALAILFTTAFLWSNVVLLIIILAILSLLMIMIENNRSVVILFFTGFILGPLSEALVIKQGAYKYAAAHLLGFPIWLPFLWGAAGVYFERVFSFLNYILRSHKSGK